MTRPNFFIVGAPKCGTTAWVEYLSTHPEIAFSTHKEPHYFNTDFPGFRWATNEAEYLAEFDHVTDEKCIGEASVEYLYSDKAASNIATFDPKARIIIFLREPAAFLRSYHNQLLLNLDEDLTDFAQAWALSGKREADRIPDTCREPKFLNYKKVGRFSEQVGRYRDRFPDDQIKIMWFDQWSMDPRSSYVELLEFLGVEDDGRTDFPVVHGAKHSASKTISKLVQRPPGWALSLSSGIKRTLGLKRLGLAAKLRDINTRKGYAQNAKDDELEKEIAAYFESDYRQLREGSRMVANE